METALEVDTVGELEEETGKELLLEVDAGKEEVVSVDDIVLLDWKSKINPAEAITTTTMTIDATTLVIASRIVCF